MEKDIKMIVDDFKNNHPEDVLRRLLDLFAKS